MKLQEFVVIDPEIFPLVAGEKNPKFRQLVVGKCHNWQWQNFEKFVNWLHDKNNSSVGMVKNRKIYQLYTVKNVKFLASSSEF